MPGPETYHSSLRKCDMYDNPYNTQMQAHPSIVKQRQESYSSQDSISSAQKKLENELFEAFKQHSMQIFSGNLFLIGQAGKYAFLAIMLPTYLFFYGIPKWLLTEAAPTVYDFSKRIVTQAGAKIGSAVSHVATAAFSIVRTVTDPILNFIQTRIQKGRELYHNVKQRLEQMAQRLYDVFMAPFRVVNQKLVKPLVQFYENLIGKAYSVRQKIAELMAFLKETNVKVRKTLIEFPEKVAETIKSIPEKLKEFSTQLKQVFLPLLNTLGKLGHNADEWMRKALEAKDHWMNKLMYKPANMAKEAYFTVKDLTQTLIRKAADPIIGWMNPKVKTATEILVAAKDRLGHIKKSVTNTLRELVDKISETVKRYSEDTSTIRQDIAQLLTQPVIAFFAPITLTAGWLMKSPRRLLKLGKSSGSKITRIKQQLQGKLALLNKRLLSLLKRGYQKAKPKTIYFAKKAAKKLKSFLQIIREMLKGALYMLRMMFAWIKVLFKHGMLAVKEVCSALLPRL